MCRFSDQFLRKGAMFWRIGILEAKLSGQKSWSYPVDK